LIDEFDTQTRTSRSVKAYEETGLGLLARDAKYRFNWNAPIHVSVHDPEVIYHGGNVLLKSSNRGFDWVEASPDLTRNEDDKQGQGSGPYTNENIEQYNTIFSFAESPHDAKVLWVGSDDGLVHVTRDGGENWDNVTPRGAGRGLINSIEVSPHDPATAYVVVMKYKEGDQKPYVYKTSNYGSSWRSISTNLPEEHFARVVREDPERPNLLYAGMERGLFISFDGGSSWRPFQGKLPVVPITDLMLRQKDLVLATQGRAFWVIDDISPLRQYDPAQEDAALHLYEPTLAYRLTPTEGRAAGGESVAPSAPEGAVIYYSLAEEPDLAEQPLTLEILNAQGEVVRSMSSNAAKGVEGGVVKGELALPAQKGVNRVVWDVRSDAVTPLDYDVVFGASNGSKSVSGYHLAPGAYTVRVSLGDEMAEQPLTVRWDPINEYNSDAIEEQQAVLAETFGMLDGLYQRVASLQAVQEQLTLRKSLAEKAGNDELTDSAQSLLDQLEDWQRAVTTPDRETFQDVLNFHPRIDSFLVNYYEQVDKAVLGLTDGQRRRLDDLRPMWNEAIAGWESLVNEAIPAFNATAGPALAVPDWE
ncbi:MAG: hypothetical protein V2I66_00375, partial [Halieaceae bacterium]|nr:hypothetical protein [Halieaceae bacterium]